MSQCSNCDGSGLLPFNKDGRVVPNAYTFCSCHPVYGDHPEPERGRDPRLEDYDFPLSDSFRGMTFEHCGMPDPGYVPLKPEPQTQVIEHRHSDMSKKDFARLNNLEGQVKYLQNKLNEMTKPKDKAHRKPTGYKGLRL